MAHRQQKVLYYLHYNIPLTNPQPTANNTQNQNGPLSPYPPAASPSLSVSRAAAPTTHGAAAPYGLMHGACHRFRRHRCWFPCLGHKRKPNENIERKMGPRPLVATNRSRHPTINPDARVGGSGRGDVIALVGGGGGRGGRPRPIVWGGE
jgi:hypothetical protein